MPRAVHNAGSLSPRRQPNSNHTLILDAADALSDLRVPPGNWLEKLQGNRADEYSIRVNRQWRICFRWTAAGPEDVQIVDYH